MKRTDLYQVPKRATEEMARELGQRVNDGLVIRLSGRLHNIHWMVLVGGILSGWGLDFVLNHVYMAANLAAGLGHWIDCLLGPIDAALIVVLPSISFKELLRRTWLRLRTKRWFLWVDEALFGAPIPSQDDQELEQPQGKQSA